MRNEISVLIFYINLSYLNYLIILSFKFKRDTLSQPFYSVRSWVEGTEQDRESGSSLALSLLMFGSETLEKLGKTVMVTAVKLTRRDEDKVPYAASALLRGNSECLLHK